MHTSKMATNMSTSKTLFSDVIGCNDVVEKQLRDALILTFNLVQYTTTE